MHSELWTGAPRARFSVEDWHNGYRRGFHEGHSAGELLGEQTLRDRLLARLELVTCDLRLGLLPVETPLEALHVLELLVEDRKTG